METLSETSGKWESDQNFVGYWNLLSQEDASACLRSTLLAHSPEGSWLYPFKALGRLWKGDPERSCAGILPRNACGSHHPFLTQMPWISAVGTCSSPLLPVQLKEICLLQSTVAKLELEGIASQNKLCHPPDSLLLCIILLHHKTPCIFTRTFPLNNLLVQHHLENYSVCWAEKLIQFALQICVKWVTFNHTPTDFQTILNKTEKKLQGYVA